MKHKSLEKVKSKPLEFEIFTMVSAEIEDVVSIFITQQQIQTVRVFMVSK